MKSIEIDRSKSLREERVTGHNRWHPDIAPILTVEPGEEVMFQCRDASDGQIIFNKTTKDNIGQRSDEAIHPLTGPVYIENALPGDLLEIEYLDIIPESTGWTLISPGSETRIVIVAGIVPSPPLDAISIKAEYVEGVKPYELTETSISSESPCMI